MKQWLILLITILLILGVMCGCRPTPTPQDPPSQEDEPPVEKPDDVPVEQDPVTIGEGATMVKTLYTTDDVVVADVIATEEPYGADPTGRQDSTVAIQKALYAVEELGGGVVYLPAGQYLVTRTVFVPAGVVLQGDWQDPATTDDPKYGTIILARPDPLSKAQLKNRAANPLFYMDGKCGMIGLTFYYPEQNIQEPIPYGYTIYGEAPSIAALRDITMINSYRGIGVCVMMTRGHELMQNESLRICALDTAIEMYRSSEVGYTVDVMISPSFWIEAGCGFACKDADALRSYCKENTLGMVFNDLDDEDFSTLYIEGCRTAVYLPATPDVAQGFWGLIYDITIKDCTYGIVAEELCPSIGTVIAHAEIDADKKAIVNSSSGGSMKLCGIELTGKGGIHAEGGDIYLDEESDISQYEIHYGSYKKPASYLYNAQIKQLSGKKKDASTLIQESLDAAAETGGVVYIPAGVYSIYQTLRVPENVQLRGPTPVFVRDASSGEPDGAVLISYVADGACIELSAGAGVNGLRIFCPLYDVGTAVDLLAANDPKTEKCIGIKGQGAGVYTYNVGVTATMIGIDFSDCDDHLIKQTFGCTYNTFAIVGGKNGVMESCLCNPHFINRQNYAGMGYLDTKFADVVAWKKYSSVSEGGVGGSEGFTELRDALLRNYCTMIEVRDAQNQAINNVFMYAPYELVSVSNSTATMINTSADFVGMGSVYHIKNNSKVAIVNALRSAGDSIICDDTVTVDLYNRINTEIYYEGNFHTDAGHIDSFDFVVTDKLELGDETAPAGNSAVVNTDPTYIKAGSASHRHNPKATEQSEILYERVFSAKDISKYMTEGGYLHMWVYVEDMSTQLWGGAFELTSAGKADTQEIFWVETSFITHNGWNEVWLPLSDVKMQGMFNSKAVNYLRIHSISNVTLGQSTMYFDDIYFCLAESDKVSYPIERTPVTERTEPMPQKSNAPDIDESYDFVWVSDGEALKNIGQSVPLKLTDDEMFVKEGDHSLLSEAGKRNNGNEIFLFRFPSNKTLDISDYMTHGYLHFWIYVEDDETFIGGELELTSSSNCDREEIKWAPSKYITRQGWNEVWLPLADAKSGSSDEFDPTALDFIRLWMLTADGTYGNYYIDDIYFCMGVKDESGDLLGKVDENGDMIFATCDSLDECTAVNVRITNDPDFVKEGDGAWWIKDNSLIVYNINLTETLDISDYMKNGYLHLWIWVSDASKIGEGQIELTSSGTCDQQELNWIASAYIKKDGWNELYLPLATAGKSSDAFNAKGLNYVRIYIFPQSGTLDYYIDDIRFTNNK